MKTLFLAWQDQSKTRAWFPIGRLDADLQHSHYRFGYTRGATKAHKEAGLEPLDAFPDFKETYESKDLFPLFKNRVLGSEREDFQTYLQQIGLSSGEANPIEILSVTGGERQTDNLEVFPKIEQSHGGFHCRFFLHGWRHVNSESRQQIRSLKESDPLQIAVELNNPVTRWAIQFQTIESYHMIGWAPRYLVEDLMKAFSQAPEDIKAKVVRINPAPAPAKLRVLIELKGRWPSNYEPMSSEVFKLIKEKN